MNGHNKDERTKERSEAKFKREILHSVYAIKNSVIYLQWAHVSLVLGVHLVDDEAGDNYPRNGGVVGVDGLRWGIA